MLVDTVYRYTLDEDGEYEDSFTLQTYDWQGQLVNDDWDLEFLAESCAKHYRDYLDGWEMSHWNKGNEALTIWVWKNENEKIKFEVWMEYEPTYTVNRIE